MIDYDDAFPDPPPAEHASLCAGCGEPLEREPSDDGLCPRCDEITGRAEDEYAR